jgi:methionyl-tRNA formyltransferase
MRVERRMDAGPVYAREVVRIHPDENVGELADRLARVGASLLVEVLDRLEDGRAACEPQDEAAATYTAKLEARDRVVPWDRPARAVHDHVRGLTPHPGATTRFRPDTGEPFAVRVTRTAIPDRTAKHEEAEAGRLLGRSGDAVRVAVGGGEVLEVRRLVPAAGREISGADFVSGRGRPGGRFG